MSRRDRVHLIVHGRVQGVFFRDSTLRRAAELNLTGTVRNLSDGTVEIVAEGDRGALDDLVLWAHQGPPAADVLEVETSWGECRDEFQVFSVIYGG